MAAVPGWKPVPDSPENPPATQTVELSGVSMPTRPTKSLAEFGSRSGNVRLADRLAVHDAPGRSGRSASRPAGGPGVVLAGEETVLGGRALEEQTLAIALADLEPERDLEQADRGHEQGQRTSALGRPLERGLGADDAGLRAVDGVAVELDEPGHPPAIEGGAQPRAADEDLGLS